MAKRNAAGAGSIRKKTVLRDGREYTYWEARLTVGVDPGTGKQIRRSFSGASQREVREKMQAAAVAVNDSTYQEPSKLTVSDWLDIWLAEYTADLKPLDLQEQGGKHDQAHARRCQVAGTQSTTDPEDAQRPPARHERAQAAFCKNGSGYLRHSAPGAGTGRRGRLSADQSFRCL